MKAWYEVHAIVIGTLLSSLAFGVTTNTTFVPRTGQTAVYRSGDDGDLECGAAWPVPRFSDCGDGTVIDNLTGLMWTRHANLPGSATNWAAAIDFCQNLSLSGYDDWRLPNVQELQSLVDYGRSQPALPSEPNPFQDVQSPYYWSSSTVNWLVSYAWTVNEWYGAIHYNTKTTSYYVWPVRSTLLETSHTNLAIRSFDSGIMTWTNIDHDMRYTIEWRSSLTDTNEWSSSYEDLVSIHCTNDIVTVSVPVFYRVVGVVPGVSTSPVPRTGQASGYRTGDDGDLQYGVVWPSPRFVSHADDVVTDRLTGLVWSRDANILGSPTSWADAVDSCSSLTLAGRDDWRLPNVRELQSLVDYGMDSPALPANHPFQNVDTATAWYCWTSTTDAGNPNDAWTVRLKDGYVATLGSKTNIYSVWPVAGGD
ncbi:MAG: DUF1566 domain-containing protein [Kiritimatiellae bacterium]|nr:DUF1566 domain-containing protein [Kiritimatiellia bacterium]